MAFFNYLFAIVKTTRILRLLNQRIKRMCYVKNQAQADTYSRRNFIDKLKALHIVGLF